MQVAGQRAKIFVLVLSVVSVASAHSGRTNSSGCHTSRKTGDYHCHGGGSTSRSSSSSPSPTIRTSSSQPSSPSATADSSGASTITTQSGTIAKGNLVYAIENLLAALGYEPGPIDTQADAASAAAIRQFEADQKIAIEGKISEHVLVALSEAVLERLTL